MVTTIELDDEAAERLQAAADDEDDGDVSAFIHRVLDDRETIRDHAFSVAEESARPNRERRGVPEDRPNPPQGEPRGPSRNDKR